MSGNHPEAKHFPRTAVRKLRFGIWHKTKGQQPHGQKNGPTPAKFSCLSSLSSLAVMPISPAAIETSKSMQKRSQTTLLGSVSVAISTEVCSTFPSPGQQQLDLSLSHAYRTASRIAVRFCTLEGADVYRSFPGR